MLSGLYWTTMNRLTKAQPRQRLRAEHLLQQKFNPHPIPHYLQDALYHVPHEVSVLPNRGLSFKRKYALRLQPTMIHKSKRHCMHGHARRRAPHGNFQQDLHPIAHHKSLCRPFLLRILLTTCNTMAFAAIGLQGIVLRE